MKAHIGVDAYTGIVHSMSATAANAHDVTQAHNLLHGGETVVWGDAGYQGVHKRRENLGLEVEWRVAMRPGSRRKQEPGSEEALREKAKASVRAKVEHPFLRLKRLFGYGKVRYRGLAKNLERLALLFGLGNSADGGGSTGGVVRITAGQRRSQGRIKSSNSPVRGETQGAECWPASPGPQFSPPSPLRQTQPRPKRPCSEDS